MPLTIIDYTRPKPSAEKPKLNARNLEILAGQNIAPTTTTSVGVFVQKQRQYKAHYASEGTKYMNMDPKQLDDEGEHPFMLGDPLPPKEPVVAYGGAFASPILKPRASAPIATEDSATGVVDPRLGQSGSIHLPIGTGLTNKSLPLHDIQLEQQSKTQSKKQKTKTLKTRPNNRQENVPPKSQVDLEEVEREARLAERRDRRRARLEAYKAPSSHHSNDRSSDAQSEQASKKTKGKKSAPKKKPKLPPGVALMQNFSAKNIGQNRLTAKPPKTLGLFNKGRASEKLPENAFEHTGSNKRSGTTSIKGLDSLFSEYAFLNKTRTKDSDASANKSKLLKRKAKQSSSSSSSEDTETRSHKTKPSAARSPTKTMKKRRAPSTSGSSSSTTTSEEIALPSKKHEEPSRRYWSPPWEVDGELVGDSRPPSEAQVVEDPQVEVTTEQEVILGVQGKWQVEGRSSTAQNADEKVPKLPVSGQKTSRFFPTSSELPAVNHRDHSNQMIHTESATASLPIPLPKVQFTSHEQPRSLPLPAGEPANRTPSPIHILTSTLTEEMIPSIVSSGDEELSSFYHKPPVDQAQLEDVTASYPQFPVSEHRNDWFYEDGQAATYQTIGDQPPGSFFQEAFQEPEDPFKEFFELVSPSELGDESIEWQDIYRPTVNEDNYRFADGGNVYMDDEDFITENYAYLPHEGQVGGELYEREVNYDREYDATSYYEFTEERHHEIADMAHYSDALYNEQISREIGQQVSRNSFSSDLSDEGLEADAKSEGDEEDLLTNRFRQGRALLWGVQFPEIVSADDITGEHFEREHWARSRR